jgi:hypothetical protein
VDPLREQARQVPPFPKRRVGDDRDLIVEDKGAGNVVRVYKRPDERNQERANA